MIVNDELKGTGKEVVVAYFKAFFWEDWGKVKVVPVVN
jgi:hypothetical protein